MSIRYMYIYITKVNGVSLLISKEQVGSSGNVSFFILICPVRISPGKFYSCWFFVIFLSLFRKISYSTSIKPHIIYFQFVSTNHSTIWRYIECVTDSVIKYTPKINLRTGYVFLSMKIHVVLVEVISLADWNHGAFFFVW